MLHTFIHISAQVQSIFVVVSAPSFLNVVPPAKWMSVEYELKVRTTTNIIYHSDALQNLAIAMGLIELAETSFSGSNSHESW